MLRVENIKKIVNVEKSSNNRGDNKAKSEFTETKCYAQAERLGIIKIFSANRTRKEGVKRMGIKKAKTQCQMMINK